MKVKKSITAKEMLEELSAIEKIMIDEDGEGARIRRPMLRSHIPSPRGAYNIIPKDESAMRRGRTDCKDSLLVIVMSERFCREKILEASRHVNVICNETKSIVFWVGGWNANAWREMKSDFENVEVWLKMFGEAAVKL